MNRKMQIIREVNNQAESFYRDAVELGDHAAIALTDRHRAQLTGLENIAESAQKTSDVFDYIKKQIARYDYWRKPLREQQQQQDGNQGFGERLKMYLETRLPTRIENIFRAIGETGAAGDERDQERREIYLLLMRQFIRQVVVEYEYQASKKGQGKES